MDLSSQLYYACGFFNNHQNKKVMLHLRDEKAPVNPNKWGFFGGLQEPEDNGDPLKTLVREVSEELGLKLEPSSIHPLCDYPSERGYQRFVYYINDDLQGQPIVLGEGQGYGWFTLPEAFELDLTTKTRKDLETFSNRLLSA